MLWFRAFSFVLFQAVAVCVVPWWLRGVGPRIEVGSFDLLGWPLVLAGAGLVLWSDFAFVTTGRGTPAPYDPPKTLVLKGLYQRTRNPMYLGAILVMLGVALLTSSLLDAIYAVAIAWGCHVWVVRVEEPRLRKRFGGDYFHYRETVPRWLPVLEQSSRPAVFGVGALAITIIGIATGLPTVGASALLHPARRVALAAMPPPCENASVTSENVELKGWRCRSTSARRGTIVYLHGISDNRSGAGGIVDRFGKRGFDVLAFDSRAQGQSTGAACTYGFYERQDLHHVIDTAEPGPVVLIGMSLGAAIALQEAAMDSRVTAVVAVETFSDLRTIATERAPFVFTSSVIRQSLLAAEREAQFDVDAVSPRIAASHINVPVIVIHGSVDSATPPVHSQRVFDALQGPKQFILVPGAGHNQSLRSEVWTQIERWLEQVVE